MNKMKRILYIAIGIILVFLILVVVYRKLDKKIFPSDNNIVSEEKDDNNNASEEKDNNYIYVKNEDSVKESYEVLNNTYSDNSGFNSREFNNYENAADILDVSIEKKDYTEEIKTKDIELAIKKFDKVGDMLSADLEIGETVETLGYYLSNDGGDAKYYITNEKANSFDKIKLDNGNTASLLTDTLGLKQIGAYGDSVHDDTIYLRWALNSDYKCVSFNPGEYKCTDKIEIKIGNKTVVGNNSKVVTKNDYIGKSWCVIQVRADNISISDLSIEARENSIMLYKGQLEIKDCTNVSLNNCSFIIPNTVVPYDIDGKTKQYTNVDMNGGWHNVSITDCAFSNLSCGLAGSCNWIRDMEGNGASDLILKDCSLIKTTHDESLAIFHGSIKNVLVENNYFEGRNEHKLSSPTDFCISVGNEKSTLCDNIRIKSNTFVGSGENFLITLGNMSNVIFEDNYFDFTKIGSSKFFLVWKLNNCTPGIPVFNNNIFNIHSDIEIDKLFAVPADYSGNQFYIGSANLKKNYMASGSIDNGGNIIYNSKYDN